MKPTIHGLEDILDDHPSTRIEPNGEVVVPSFRDELESLINSNCGENGSDTPDFILADYLSDCLIAFDKAVCRRREWHSNENTKDWHTKL